MRRVTARSPSGSDRNVSGYLRGGRAADCLQQVTSTVTGALAMSAFLSEVPATWADLPPEDRANEALPTSSILPPSSAWTEASLPTVAATVTTSTGGPVYTPYRVITPAVTVGPGRNSAPERAAAIGRLCDFYLRATTAAARVLYPNMQRLPSPERFADTAGVADGDTGVAFGGHADALDWLETERANLVTTVTWAAGHEPREAAWLIADAMRGYLWMRRYAADWLAVAEAGLAAAADGLAADGHEDDRERRAIAAANISLAQAKRLLTRYDAAADHLEQAAALAQRAGWQQGAAAAFGSLANVYRDQGRMAESADNHRRALGIYRATGGRGGAATSLVNLGNVLLETGKAADAVAHLEQALAIHREIGARTAEGNVLNSLGCAYLIQGASEAAQRYFDAALAVHRESGSLEGEADDLSNMAELHIDACLLDRARELAMASLALARRSGERRIKSTRTTRSARRRGIRETWRRVPAPPGGA